MGNKLKINQNNESGVSNINNYVTHDSEFCCVDGCYGKGFHHLARLIVQRIKFG